MRREDLIVACECGDMLQVQSILPDFAIMECAKCKKKFISQDGEVKPITFPLED